MEKLNRIYQAIVAFFEVVAEARANHIREINRYRGYY
jgi:hypothetical protein